jgi:hypothetical protein
MSLDLNNSYQQAQEKIKSLKTFKEVSDAAKGLENANQKIPFDQFDTNLVSPLEKLKEAKKRFQRQGQSQLQNLISLAKENAGSGSGAIGTIKKKFLEAYTRCEPKIKQIMQDEMFTAVGCSQEQTYSTGTNSAIYIPLQAIDLFEKLKQSPTNGIGKLIYEKETPTYGQFPFAMNKELYNRTQDPDQTFSVFFGNSYAGTSNQELFDISYVKQNGQGITGDFFKVNLKQRASTNNVGEFLTDYMSTINVFDSNNIMAEIVNIITGAVDMKASVGTGPIETKSQFDLIIQRVLGLCFDDRKEIDVSGVAKVAELDGVDESFFRMTDVDRAIIDNRISNIQLRTMEFTECNNVRVNVDFNNIVNQMIDAVDTKNLNDPNVLQAEIEQIIDSVSNNPSWKLVLPNDFNIKLSIDEGLLAKLPLALVASVLSPKVLLPIFIMIIAIGKEYADEVKSLQDFLVKFQKFFISFVSKVGAIFIEELFEIIKRDLMLLVQSVLSEISKAKILKQYAMITSLLEVATAIAALIDDYRKCKSLIDNILNILSIIGRSFGIKLPYPLMLLSSLLGGTSPQGTTINIIEQLQKLGIPTGPLPDGSPNLGLVSELARQTGQELAEASSGFVQVAIPPDLILPSGRPSQGMMSGKKF